MDINNSMKNKVNNLVPDKLHYTPDFHNYYFEIDDSTGTNKGKTFIGRKHDDWGTDFHKIAQKVNKHVDKNFNQGKIK